MLQPRMGNQNNEKDSFSKGYDLITDYIAAVIVSINKTKK